MKERTRKRSKADEYSFQKSLQLKSEGNLAGAEKLLSELVQSSSADTEAFLILGTVLYAQDKYSGAAAAFSRVLDDRPTHEPSSLGLFHSLWALGKQVEALDEMKRFLSIAHSQEYSRLLNDIDHAMKAEE